MLSDTHATNLSPHLNISGEIFLKPFLSNSDEFGSRQVIWLEEWLEAGFDLYEDLYALYLYLIYMKSGNWIHLLCQ